MNKTEKRTCSCDRHFCFYNSIIYACGGQPPSSHWWTTPIGMKRFLKIADDAPILLSHIALLETKINVSISVVGDSAQYTSTSNYPKKLTLTMKQGHFSFFGKRQQIDKIWRQNLKFIMYEKMDGFFLTYDGTDLVADYTLKATELGNCDDTIYRRLRRHKWTDEMKASLAALLATQKSGKVLSEAKDYDELLGDFLVQTYDTFVQQCAHLKTLDPDIDIEANGYSVKDTALHLFSKWTNPYTFDPIDDREFEWISGTKCYGLLYAKPSTFKGRCYDANSFYPSIMKDPKLILPIGKPEYRTLNALGDVVSFGIYRAKISGADCRLFIQNPLDYYTYTDIKEARKRGYSVELICDGKPNHLFYDSGSRETGHYLFSGYVDKLYPLKSKNQLVKELQSVLWGAMCERRKVYHDDEEVDFDNLDWADICENDTESSFVEKAKKYVLPHARVGVFITAMGRAKLADAIADIKDEVFRIHTDSYTSTSNRLVKLSTELGGWKLESEGIFQVVNMRKPLMI